jgi:hypothetical protein
MTKFRYKVLKAVKANEHTGSIEVALMIYGYPTALEMHNCEKALKWLEEREMFNWHDFTVTDKGLGTLTRFGAA